MSLKGIAPVADCLKNKTCGVYGTCQLDGSCKCDEGTRQAGPLYPCELYDESRTLSTGAIIGIDQGRSLPLWCGRLFACGETRNVTHLQLLIPT